MDITKEIDKLCDHDWIICENENYLVLFTEKENKLINPLTQESLVIYTKLGFRLEKNNMFPLSILIQNDVEEYKGDDEFIKFIYSALNKNSRFCHRNDKMSQKTLKFVKNHIPTELEDLFIFMCEINEHAKKSPNLEEGEEIIHYLIWELNPSKYEEEENIKKLFSDELL